jgi:hypothetical protein
MEGLGLRKHFSVPNFGGSETVRSIDYIVEISFAEGYILSLGSL